MAPMPTWLLFALAVAGMVLWASFEAGLVTASWHAFRSAFKVLGGAVLVLAAFGGFIWVVAFIVNRP